MSVSAPPRPPRPGDPISREEAEALVEALIEEARQRARLRRQKYAAFAMVATLAAVVVTTVLERSTGAESQSPALAARSAPAAGAARSRIAFMWHPSSAQPSYSALPLADNPELWVMSSDGTAQRRLTRGWVSSWSPDGRQVAFERWRDDNSDVYVVNSDGSDLRRLTRNTTYDGGAVWSPDGRRIAFVSGVFSGRDLVRSDVYVMNADGTARRRLTHDAAAEGGHTWSPDGRQIAFVLWPDKLRRRSDVYVMNADGSRKRRLTRGYAPRWSPDGTTLLFSRGRVVYAMNADGSGQRRLARGEGALWSPDGKRILFLRGQAAGRSWSPPELTVMNADGSGQRGLRIVSYDGAATWSPDGRKIVFASGAVQNTEIYVMNVDGSGLQRLTRLKGRALAPLWSPGR